MHAASPQPSAPEAAVSPSLAVVDAPAAPEGWSLAQRLAFRFVFVYLVLYTAPFPLDVVGPAKVGEALDALWHGLVPWVGRHVLGLTRDIVTLDTGSGDTTYHYVQVLVFAGLAAGGAGAWSWVDRARRDYTRAHALLRVHVRYVLAAAMLSYGLSKVFQTQFPFPGPERLSAPLGELSPQELVWTFMGYSRGYNLFTGGAEVVGGLLLFSRRTTTLGALVLATVMSNVVALNVFYDIPVKIYSSHLLGMCGFLMWPDARRLLQVLVLNQTAVALAPRAPWAVSGARQWGLRGAKTLFVGVLVYQPVHDRLERVRRPAFPLEGLYTVESFSRDGQAWPPRVGDGLGWKSVSINRFAWMTPRSLDDVPQPRFRLQEGPASATLTVTRKLSPRNLELPLGAPSAFTYARPDAEHLTLTGSLEGVRIEARLRRVDPAWSPLLGPGFHWIRE
jgi:uncharacterized membrane protein YphA (DoxX/SURF4 family)